MNRLLFLFIAGFLYACNGIGSRGEAKMNVESWLGKKILYPTDILFTIQEDTVSVNNLQTHHNYKIVSYVDSTGCTSCRLQLPRWSRLLEEINADLNGKVGLNFILHTQDDEEVMYALKYNNFKYPVCVDKQDTLNKLNHFPTDEAYQTFLLDKDNRVLAIGNPIHNPKVKELYLKIIRGEEIERRDEIKVVKTRVEIDKTVVSLGSFDRQEEQKATFVLKNTGDRLLVVQDVTTSCGCTTVTYAKEPVQPGGEVVLEVAYKADYPEHFDKTITVYCNAEASPLVLKISGNAK